MYHFRGSVLNQALKPGPVSQQAQAGGPGPLVGGGGAPGPRQGGDEKWSKVLDLNRAGAAMDAETFTQVTENILILSTCHHLFITLR